MIINGFVAYVKQKWYNRPNFTTPILAERLLHLEDGIKGNSDAVEKLAAAVINQITNDPNKIASMAALFAVNQKVTQLNSDMTSKNLAGTDLNDFKNFSKHLIGHGTGYASSVVHAPWTAAFVVEYIPYGESYGVQTAYSVQKMDGMYQSAKRTYDQGYGGWSAWEYTSFDIRRNTNLTEGIDFNQVGLTKSEDGSYSLHFYKDGLWITNI